MAYEQKDNSGSLFTNENKTRDSQPDWRGSALIDGVEYWVSSWDKDGRKGPWRSLSFQKKEEKREQPRQYPDDRITTGPQTIRERAMQTVRPRDMDDEVPF